MNIIKSYCSFSLSSTFFKKILNAISKQFFFELFFSILNNGYISCLLIGCKLNEKKNDDFSKNLLFCIFIDISESKPLKRKELNCGIEATFILEFSSKKKIFLINFI